MFGVALQLTDTAGMGSTWAPPQQLLSAGLLSMDILAHGMVQHIDVVTTAASRSAGVTVRSSLMAMAQEKFALTCFRTSLGLLRNINRVLFR